MHILSLKLTSALLTSLTATLLIGLATIYWGNTANYFSYSVYAGRLLKEDLFFKENNIARLKMWAFSYFFIFNMVFDIITNIIFIFIMSKKNFYVYLMVGYSLLKVFIMVCIATYYDLIDLYYRRKDRTTNKYKELAIKKILETNPNFL